MGLLRLPNYLRTLIFASFSERVRLYAGLCVSNARNHLSDSGRHVPNVGYYHYTTAPQKYRKSTSFKYLIMFLNICGSGRVAKCARFRALSLSGYACSNHVSRIIELAYCLCFCFGLKYYFLNINFLFCYSFLCFNIN